MAKKPRTDPNEIAVASQESSEMVIVKPDRPTDTLGMIALAIERGLDPDKLTKLFDLHERDQKNKAIVAFNEAMNAAQAEMPTILCDAHNKQTNSDYVKVEGINKIIKPIYTRHGFSLAFGEGETKMEKHCRTTCDVRHVGGHCESFHIDLPLDGVGIKGNQNMTAIHARLSSDTYAQARLLRKIFNLTVTNDATDNDGNDVTCISEDQLVELNTIIESIQNQGAPFDLGKFCAWLNAEKLGDIQEADFEKAKVELQKREAKAPTYKKLIEYWTDWFSKNPTVADLNVHLLDQFKGMEAGWVKNYAFAFCTEEAKRRGFDFNGKQFTAGAK